MRPSQILKYIFIKVRNSIKIYLSLDLHVIFDANRGVYLLSNKLNFKRIEFKISTLHKIPSKSGVLYLFWPKSMSTLSNKSAAAKNCDERTNSNNKIWREEVYCLCYIVKTMTIFSRSYNDWNLYARNKYNLSSLNIRTMNEWTNENAKKKKYLTDRKSNGLE